MQQLTVIRKCGHTEMLRDSEDLNAIGIMHPSQFECDACAELATQEWERQYEADLIADDYPS